MEEKTERTENRGESVSNSGKKENATFWSSSNYKYTPVN
jgi:hypothetical protein